MAETINEKFYDDYDRYSKEQWNDVSSEFVKKITYVLPSLAQAGISSKYTDKEEEQKRLNTTHKDILVFRLETILLPQHLSFRLGCVNNRRFAFSKPDRPIRFDYMVRSDSEQDLRETYEQYYIDSVKTFIELIQKAIEEDNEHGELSIHMIANLSADARDTEHDEFLAIVTPNNNTIIMMGFFYSRYYG